VESSGWLAQDLVAPADLPAIASAARDGWAVAAADTAGAGSYSPAPLRLARWIEAGSPLPPGSDAVLPTFDVADTDGSAMALAEAVAGDGLRLPGTDARAGQRLRRAGERLRALDLPLLAAAGITEVAVRCARIAILPVGSELAAGPSRDTLGPLLQRLAAWEGAAVRVLPPVPDDPQAVAATLRDIAPQADLLITLGGTGEGQGDRTAAGLALAGHLAMHGLGARPGHSAGLGMVAGRPVVMLPGQVPDAFAAWLLLARPALRRLVAACPQRGRAVRLGRRITSAIGLAEVVLLRRTEEPGVMEPLATGTLTLAALSQADAVLVVPPASEGYEGGAGVEVEDL
jgi:molybdenum cofactor synthesis domain-containing protein